MSDDNVSNGTRLSEIIVAITMKIEGPEQTVEVKTDEEEGRRNEPLK